MHIRLPQADGTLAFREHLYGLGFKVSMLAVVANCFVERRSASGCTLALAELAHGMA
jgi:hypothetical protein